VGNVIGSNIFNLTAVLGVAAVVEPLSIASGVLDREFLAVVVLSILVWPVAWTALKVRRSEGLLLLVGYAVLWLWLGQS
jgi:cation:H+ antiporter